MRGIIAAVIILLSISVCLAMSTSMRTDMRMGPMPVVSAGEGTFPYTFPITF